MSDVGAFTYITPKRRIDQNLTSNLYIRQCVRVTQCMTHSSCQVAAGAVTTQNKR